MYTLGDAVRHAREQRGLTVQNVADHLGIGVSAMSKKERGELRIKPDEKLAIAEVLGMSASDLDRLAAGVPGGLPSSNSEMTDIPVLNRAAAGFVIDYNIDAANSTTMYEPAHQYLPRGDISPTSVFALVVHGDMMAPNLHEGDYAIFAVATPGKVEPRQGDCVCAYFDPKSGRRGARIGIYCQAGDQVVLIPTNRQHAPLVVRNEDISRLGVFVEKRCKRF